MSWDVVVITGNVTVVTGGAVVVITGTVTVVTGGTVVFVAGCVMRVVLVVGAVGGAVVVSIFAPMETASTDANRTKISCRNIISLSILVER